LRKTYNERLKTQPRHFQPLIPELACTTSTMPKKTPMICLLSPAKTLDMSKTSNGTMSDPCFLERSAALVAAMKAMTKPKLKSLLSVSDAIASLNYDRVANFDGQSSKQCGLAYDGPAYKGLAAPTWARGEGAFAQEHLRILSGLYGVLRPFDCIRPYRLDMGTKLATADHADLYGYWGTSIAEQLVRDLKALGGAEGGERGDGGIIVNCASQEYFKAVQADRALPANVRLVTCSFPGPSVYAKRARGMMCRYICLQRVCDVEKLRSFTGYDGEKYAFSAAQSSDDTLVFLRTGGAKDAARKGVVVDKEKVPSLQGAAKNPKFKGGATTKKVPKGRKYRGRSGGEFREQSERKKLVQKLPRGARRMAHATGS